MTTAGKSSSQKAVRTSKETAATLRGRIGHGVTVGGVARPRAPVHSRRRHRHVVAKTLRPRHETELTTACAVARQTTSRPRKKRRPSPGDLVNCAKSVSQTTARVRNLCPSLTRHRRPVLLAEQTAGDTDGRIVKRDFDER